MAMPLLFAVDWFRSGCCSGQREFKGNVLEAAGKDFLSKLKEGKPSEKLCVLTYICKLSMGS